MFYQVIVGKDCSVAESVHSFINLYVNVSIRGDEFSQVIQVLNIFRKCFNLTFMYSFRSIGDARK